MADSTTPTSNTKTYLALAATALACAGVALNHYLSGGFSFSTLIGDLTPLGLAIAAIFHIGEQHS